MQLAEAFSLLHCATHGKSCIAVPGSLRADVCKGKYGMQLVIGPNGVPRPPLVMACGSAATGVFFLAGLVLYCTHVQSISTEIWACFWLLGKSIASQSPWTAHRGMAANESHKHTAL